MIIPFEELFALKEEGIKPKRTIKVGSVVFTPSEIFTAESTNQGVNLFRFMDKRLDVEKDHDGAYLIKGYFL